MSRETGRAQPSSPQKKAAEEEKRIAEFRGSCRVYRKEKEQIAQMEKADPSLKRADLSDESGLTAKAAYYRMLKQDVKYTESVLRKVEKECGKNARMIIQELFMNQKTQKEVGDMYGLTRRQLSYSVRKWLVSVL